MKLEEILQRKQVKTYLDEETDYNNVIVNEKCFSCKSVMSFDYNLEYLHNPYGNIVYSQLRLCVGRCVKCNEFHYGLFYGEKKPFSIFFFPDAEMMFSEFNTFENFLTEKQLSDLKNAYKAHNNGLHAGAFLYIRRILESLVFQVLDDNNVPHSNNEKFKDLLKKAEDYIELFPKDFADVRGIFYRFICEGVHEWTDEECSVQYPLAEYAIRRILTHYKQNKENEEQTTSLLKAIGSKINEKRS